MPHGQVHPKQLALALGKSGNGKTILALQVAAKMAAQGVEVMYVSLEQPREQIFVSLSRQQLGLSHEEVEDILTNDPSRAKKELAKLDLTIVDNVPAMHSYPNIGPAPTPKWLKRLIEQIKPQAVFVDHLGQMQVEYIPANAHLNNEQQAGLIMQELSQVAKETNTYLQVLQNLPKDVPAGCNN